MLLVLSFLSLPAGSLSFTHFEHHIALVLCLPLLLPWIYSMVEAAGEAVRLKRQGQQMDARRGAILVLVLLLVIFPIVAFIFSLATLLLLPTEVLEQMADWVERVKQACGLRG